MTHPDQLETGVIETLFDSLSEAVDRAGPENESLFLAKLVLLMAQEIRDPTRIADLIAEASLIHDD